MAINWTLETTPSAGTQGWTDVIWVSWLGLYVAAGGGNPNKVMTSPDSITWTARPIANVRNILSLACSGTAIVGLSGSASNQCVFTSPDGINWTLRAATPYGASKAMRAVAYGAGIFVAVGGVNQSMYSLDDGVTWTASAALPDTLASLSCICYDASSARFVALATVGDVRVMTSPDGITWTGHHGFEVAYQRNWVSLAANGANLAAVCTAGTTTQQVITSAGNVDDPWTFETTPQDPEASVQWKCLRAGSGLIRWVAVGRQVNAPRQTGYLVMTSSGNGTWTAETSPDDTENIFWNGVCYSSTLAQYVAVGFRELDHTTEALGGIASNDVTITGSGGLIVNRGTTDNGMRLLTVPYRVGGGGLILNRGGGEGMLVSGVHLVGVFGAGGLVLNRGTAGPGPGGNGGVAMPANQICAVTLTPGADSAGGTGWEETLTPGTDSSGGTGCAVTQD